MHGFFLNSVLDFRSLLEDFWQLWKDLLVAFGKLENNLLVAGVSLGSLQLVQCAATTVADGATLRLLCKISFCAKQGSIFDCCARSSSVQSC